MTGNLMIWVLTDNRSGHNAQSLGLAQALGRPFEEKRLHYNLFGNLPNGLLGRGLWHLAAQSRSPIAPPWPSLVIAAGRRMVPVMRHIKQQSPQTKLVQLMWPGRMDPFDFVIVPEHDSPPEDARVIRTLGALHGLTETAMKQAAEDYVWPAGALPKPHIAVFIGGKLPRGDLHRLCDLSELLVGNGSLLITTSRRTPAQVVSWINKRLTCPYHLHQWGSHDPNPYLAWLALADGFVVTADSISMLSEACYTGKPVFAFMPAEGLPTKHRQFCESLFAQHYAYPLTPESKVDGISINRLDERQKIARILSQGLN